MAHLHNFAKQTGIVMGQIRQKVKNIGEIAGSVKAIYEIGSFFKNAMTAAAPLALAL